MQWLPFTHIFKVNAITLPLTAQLTPDDLIAVCPASDLFVIGHGNINTEIIDMLFAVMSLSEARFVVISRDAFGIQKRMTKDTFEGNVLKHRLAIAPRTEDTFEWPLPNVIIGASCCNGKEYIAAKGLPGLRAIGRSALFFEPLLEDIALDENAPRPDWIVCGGLEGPSKETFPSNLNPLIQHPEWARKIRDYAILEDIPFFFSSWGASHCNLSELGCYEQRIGPLKMAYMDCMQYQDVPDIGWTGNPASGSFEMNEERVMAIRKEFEYAAFHV